MKLQQKRKTHEICKTISTLTAKMYQNSAMEVGAFLGHSAQGRRTQRIVGMQNRCVAWMKRKVLDKWM